MFCLRHETAQLFTIMLHYREFDNAGRKKTQRHGKNESRCLCVQSDYTFFYFFFSEMPS